MYEDVSLYLLAIFRLWRGIQSQHQWRQCLWIRLSQSETALKGEAGRARSRSGNDDSCIHCLCLGLHQCCGRVIISSACGGIVVQSITCKGAMFVAALQIYMVLKGCLLASSLSRRFQVQRLTCMKNCECVIIRGGLSSHLYLITLFDR